MLYPPLRQSQVQRVPFVMIDDSCDEVSGLSTTLRVSVSKDGGALSESTGNVGEIGSGWYYYELTAAETDTPGALVIQIMSSRIDIQRQNLAFFVRDPAGVIEFTYTLTDDDTGNPIDGATIWITTDVDGDHTVWVGQADAFGVARDTLGQLPLLDEGTYYVWRQMSGYTFDNPDTEQVG